MTAFQHFPSEEIRDDLVDLILALVGYDPLTRKALLAGIPLNFAGQLPGGQAPPRTGLFLDLQFMNSVERLTNGIVPLKAFFQNVQFLAGPVEAADAIRLRIENIEAETTGAPRIDVQQLPEVQEKIVFQDDMVSYDFMAAGLAAASAVAKLSVPRFDNGAPRMNGASPMVYLGTGWLIGRGVLMTNHHVVNARNEGEAAASEADLAKQVAGAVALFDYDHDGVAGSSTPLGELIAWHGPLDYALVRIANQERPPLVCATETIKELKPGNTVALNIVQHPDGKPKRYAIRNNLVTAASATELRYFTDTMGGSSGSPVLNDRWQVLALHRGSAFVRGVRFQGRDVAYVNVGTQIEAILVDLKARFSGKIPELEI